MVVVAPYNYFAVDRDSDHVGRYIVSAVYLHPFLIVCGRNHWKLF
jgi:hypothetical protein